MYLIAIDDLGRSFFDIHASADQLEKYPVKWQQHINVCFDLEYDITLLCHSVVQGSSLLLRVLGVNQDKSSM